MPVAAGNCSFVNLQVRNEGDLDYYLGGFYVDSLGGVTAIPTNVATSGCARTLPAGSEGALSFKFWIDTWHETNNKPSSMGVENFLLLSIPKDETRTPPALCALLQPTLVAAQQNREIEIAAGQENGLPELLNGIVDAPSRGISVAAAGDDQSEITARLLDIRREAVVNLGSGHIRLVDHGRRYATASNNRRSPTSELRALSAYRLARDGGSPASCSPAHFCSLVLSFVDA